MAIESTAIADVDTVGLTVPPGKRYAVTTILVCNTHQPEDVDTDEGKTVFDMHFVKSGEGISTTNLVINSLPMPAAETFTFDTEKIILDEGDSIVFNSDSPTNLVCTISYLEV